MQTETITRIIATIEAQGYCVIPSVIPAAAAERVREVLDELRRLEPRPDVQELGHHRVLHLVVKHPIFVELMCHPVVMAVMGQYLGEDFICSTWSANTVMPGADPSYWHVDHPYWTIAPPYPVDPALTAHAIWCLDEFREANGATKFVPGSHRRSHIPVHEADHDHEGVTVEAPAGSLILAHGACWHSMGRNHSDAARTAIFGRYARSYIVLQEDMPRQLAQLADPSPLVERLLGGKQYVPLRGFPY